MAFLQRPPRIDVLVIIPSGGVRTLFAVALLAVLFAPGVHSGTRWTILPCYTFTAREIAAMSGVDISIIEAVLDAFTKPHSEKNQGFGTLHDFKCCQQHAAAGVLLIVATKVWC